MNKFQENDSFVHNFCDKRVFLWCDLIFFHISLRIKIEFINNFWKYYWRADKCNFKELNFMLRGIKFYKILNILGTLLFFQFKTLFCTSLVILYDSWNWFFKYIILSFIIDLFIIPYFFYRNVIKKLELNFFGFTYLLCEMFMDLIAKILTYITC